MALLQKSLDSDFQINIMTPCFRTQAQLTPEPSRLLISSMVGLSYGNDF